jgi:mannose-6-phosphate isomerase-like protein (cupin superfamily)
MAVEGARGAAIDDLPELWDGFARLVRAGLGIEGFGANVMNLPPDYATKSHDESGSGQEELYVALSGSGAVVVDDDGEELPLDAEHVVAVAPATSRTLRSGPDGLRVLIVGGAPGRPYAPQDWSSAGA